jgi:hypothetical protein
LKSIDHSQTSRGKWTTVHGFTTLPAARGILPKEVALGLSPTFESQGDISQGSFMAAASAYRQAKPIGVVAFATRSLGHQLAGAFPHGYQSLTVEQQPKPWFARRHLSNGSQSRVSQEFPKASAEYNLRTSRRRSSPRW